MKTFLAFFLLVSAAHAEYLSFEGMYQSELPAVGDGFTISQVGTKPDSVTFEGPRPHDFITVVPKLSDSFMEIVQHTDQIFVRVNPCLFTDVDGNCIPTAESSDYGYRLDFDGPVDLSSISIHNKSDTDLFEFRANVEATWRILSNAADFIEISPGVLQTTTGLRTENGSIGIPIAALALDGATWWEWRYIGFGSTQIAQNVGVGNIHVVPEPSALLLLGVLGTGLFAWRW